MVLAAGASITKNIKLSSAVTVLSSADPIRVYQNFSTLDALSNGGAEVMVGRGSFTESFPLFGYKLEDYDELFTEKLEILLKIKENLILNWEGKLTHNVDNRGVYPRSENLPIWVVTGGNVDSTINIALKGLPITYAIIGGNPMVFKKLINLYKALGERAGHSPDKLKVASSSWGFIHQDKNTAIEKYYYPTKQLVDAVSKDREHWQELTWEQYINSISEDGAMFVGDPITVANKIIKMVEELKLDRFMSHLPIGSMEHEDVMNAIRLYGEEVAPIVRGYFKDK
nr:LLM class flavin-dependent oxidoreductase [Pseudostreptobacillus hongkongensis]